MDEYELKFIEYNRGNNPRARGLRNKQTPAEKILREKVLKRKQTGYLFLRQKPIGGFILDFYCSELLLGIEVDGNIHENRKEYDKQRDERIKYNDIIIIRFKNKEIYNNIEGVKKEIIKFISRNQIINPLPG